MKKTHGLGSFENPFIDSSLTCADALADHPDRPCPTAIKRQLIMLGVMYISIKDGLYHQGQLVVNRSEASNVAFIFQEICNKKFPIHRVIPAAHPDYHWDDQLLMRHNITSGYNFRPIGDTKVLSWHGCGLAIDINPLQNPYFREGGIIEPAGADYEPSLTGTITADSIVVKLFKQFGWVWGGDWNNKDFMHFEKPLPKKIILQ